MPWFIEEREGEYCVVKGTRENPIETERCHATEEAARAHMAALYAGEPEAEESVEKRSDKPGDYLVVENRDMPTTWHLQVRVDGKPDHNLMGAAWAALHSGYRGNKYEGPGKAQALSKLRALYESEEMPLPTEKEDDMDDDDMEEDDIGKSVDRLFVYKAADGSMRWASISNMAVKDKEFEIITETAYDDAIEHASETGDFGELDLVHIPGTDVGKCDMMARAGNKLIESGTWDESDLAQRVMGAIANDADYWGVSLKFVYDPSKFDGEKYHGNIRIRKRTILPQEMAASFGTRIVAMAGGETPMTKMSDETRAALKKLGVSEDEIEALAEKSLTPEEPNTVEKQEETQTAEPAQVEEVQPEKVSVWQRAKSILSNLFVDDGVSEPDAETGGVETATEVVPVEVQEPETEKQALDAETLQKLAEAIATPLVTKMAEMGAELEAVKARLAEAEGVVEDKIINKLLEIPPVVKVRASQVEVTATDEPKTRVPVLPDSRPESDNYVADLMKGVTEAVERGINQALPKAQI